MAGIDLHSFDALTLDCYGTLIDWETGLLAVLRPILDDHGVEIADEDLLALHARHETELEAGPHRAYAEVLAGSLARIGAGLGFEPSAAERDRFAGSVGEWPAFDDSREALARLSERYWLAVITNCDDELFAASARRLGVEFECVVTAEQARAYKPSHAPFELAFDRLGLPRDRILHVAQSCFHDHVPAGELGLASVRVDRRGAKPGPGATPAADAAPDLIVRGMRELAELAA
ncbi:MAG TPA: haloacid dehalogenase type II [Solirubrobacterales bacterium]